MTKNEFIKIIREAVQPEFDKIQNNMVTKQDLQRVITVQSDKIAEWFEAYGKAQKKNNDEIRKMIKELKK